jgi:hypothetical protein
MGKKIVFLCVLTYQIVVLERATREIMTEAHPAHPSAKLLHPNEQLQCQVRIPTVHLTLPKISKRREYTNLMVLLVQDYEAANPG